ncbi:putative pH-response regulator protein palH rim-21 [Rosellinia necatrix]|uniref:Putative pH-response regulator protein palH rim-21 n=1 Tax=Rosellinia necatrix TaxID=77044 RepID=A0A1W2TLY6_ROSNE|nr:putative pH-response regulator protein palH rim-21 [Rosellinia necatrix]
MAAACAPLTLAAGGVLSIVGATPTTLASNVVYLPSCATAVATAVAMARRAIIVTGGVSTDVTEPIDSPNINDLRTPFYATIFPQCYALAATTVLAYMLLIMLLIVPRSFLDGGVVTLGRRGFTHSHSNGITIGGRPWLQKFAALSVAVSLTIATVDTFRVAEEQYLEGFQDAHKLQERVLGGTQLKIIQLISDTFLWLAQAQTLIRLFPRQREKIIIKWTAFALITLDVVFGALNSFRYVTSNNFKPRQFTEAIPALSYLFQLSLGLLYAAWVLYYALMKKRYAFYHPLMKNISLMATLSIGSLLVPVVFFVLDIAEPNFTGWGDYVRWVGAAAASVVVWEWVERIEALEREEKKDGVLGREVFDGDEMIDMSPSDLTWPRRRKNLKNNNEPDGGETGIPPPPSSGHRENLWPAMSSIARRYRSKSNHNPSQVRPAATSQSSAPGKETARFLQPPLWPSRPAPAVTPVSRIDTASADSTIYRVRYQPPTEIASRATDRYRPVSTGDTITSATEVAGENDELPTNIPTAQRNVATTSAQRPGPESNKRWGPLMPPNPLRRKSRDPPAEVLPHTRPRTISPPRDHDRWDIRGRMEDFTAIQAERVLQRIRPPPDTDSLPVTVIPAPDRPGAALARLLEEESLTIRPPSPPNLSDRGPGNPDIKSRAGVPPSPGRTQSQSAATQPTRSPLLNPPDDRNSPLRGPADRRNSPSDSNVMSKDKRGTPSGG